MTKTKSKRKSASRANDSKTKTRNSVRRTTARKAVQLKPVTKPAAHQQPQSASQPTARPRKQKGSHHCNVASARWRDHRGDGTCSEVATPFGPRLPRRCRAQEAWPHSCLGRRREWARLPDYGSHDVGGSVVRCGKHDRLRRRHPDYRRRRDRASARSRSPWLAGALEEHASATAASSSAPPSAVCRSRLPAPGR